MAKAMPDVGESTHASLLPDDAVIKARHQAQEERKRSFAAEMNADSMVEVVGGPAGDSTVAVSGTPPEGSYCVIAGGRYQWREGKLHYAPHIQQVKK